LSPEILKASGILPFEKVYVLNMNNGARFETYTITGKPESKEISLNGPAARLGLSGDELIIITYGIMDEKEARLIIPKLIELDSNNHVVSTKDLIP